MTTAAVDIAGSRRRSPSASETALGSTAITTEGTSSGDDTAAVAVARLRAAAAVEWARGLTRAQLRAARAVVDRRVVQAVGAGVSVAVIAQVLERAPGTVIVRLRRGRRTARDSWPAELLTARQVAAALGVPVAAVHRLRTDGSLSMHRRDGWWVATRADVDDHRCYVIRRPSASIAKGLRPALCR